MVKEITPRRRWASLAVLVGAVLLLAIDATVLYLAVPSLTRDLGATSAQVLWIGDIYSLALAGLLVTMGNLADHIGRKKLLLIGAASFGAASALAAFAPSAEMLIFARLLLGVAGATIMPSTLSLIRNIFTDEKERTRAIAIWSAAAASGIALGPLVGGVLLENFWWGSVFLINVPIIAVVLIAGFVLLPESRNPNPGRFDLLSSALSMLAIVPVVYVIKKVVAGDLSLPVWLVLIVGIVGFVLFLRRQRTSENPMIDIELFGVPQFSGAVSTNFIAIFALTGFLFVFAQYLQLGRGLSPLLAGLSQLPVALSSIMVILVVGRVLAKLGLGRAIATALLVAATGLVLLSIAEAGDNMVWLLLALVPIGMGIGLTQTLSVDAVVSAVKPAKAGAAASIAETAYELGVALGIAVMGSLMGAFYRANLTLPTDLPADAARTAHDSFAGAAQVLEGPALEAARGAFVTGMQATTLIAAGAVLIAAFVAWKLIPAKKSVPGGH